MSLASYYARAERQLTDRWSGRMQPTLPYPSPDYQVLPGQTVYRTFSFALECISEMILLLRWVSTGVLRLVGWTKMDAWSAGIELRVSVARLQWLTHALSLRRLAISLGIANCLFSANRANFLICDSAIPRSRRWLTLYAMQARRLVMCHDQKRRLWLLWASLILDTLREWKPP